MNKKHHKKLTQRKYIQSDFSDKLKELSFNQTIVKLTLECSFVIHLPYQSLF